MANLAINLLLRLTCSWTHRITSQCTPPQDIPRCSSRAREHCIALKATVWFFGVTPQPDYPVRNIFLRPGDRLLLYTDGVIEPENAKGKPFSDSKLEQVVLGAQMCPPSELSDRLLTEIRAWQPPSMAQQDDITLIVIDVL